MPITALAEENEEAGTVAKVYIDELTLNDYDSSESDGKVFNSTNLKKLYAAILGTEEASYEDLKDKLYEDGIPVTETYNGFDVDLNEQSVKVPYGITAEDLRGQNYGGNEITVTFGGIEWYVVYITTASGEREGHVIIDLWQKDGIEESSFSGGAGNSSQRDTNAENPSHLYSTSYIRSQALNAGSAYYTYETENMSGISERIGNEGQNAQNSYAKFTMTNEALSETDNAGKSLVKYIAKPLDVKYQEIESWLGVVGQDINGSGSYCMPNEAYGTPWRECYSNTNSINTGYGGNGKNLKNGYGDWADDYIWLPSLSEVSENYFDNRKIGIWGLSKEQRTTDKSAWLRTGSFDNAGESMYINNGGTAMKTTNQAFYVRPALHLDLTEAEKAVKLPTPKGITASFDESAKVYAFTTETELRKWLTVNIVYDNGETLKTDNYSIKDFVLEAGKTNIITLVYSSSEGEFTAEIGIDGVEEAELIDLTAEFDIYRDYEFYPYSDINCLKPYITVKAKWNYDSEYKIVKAENYSLKLNKSLFAGEEADVSVVYANKEARLSPAPVVKKGIYDMSGVELVGETQVEYDGKAHGLEVCGNMPDGVQLTSITYVSDGGYNSSDRPVDAGEYTVVATFAGDEQNFNLIENITAKLTILKKVYLIPNIESKQYTGEDIDFTPHFIVETAGLVKLYVDGVENSKGFIKREAGDYSVKVEINSKNIIFEGGQNTADLKFCITKKLLKRPEYVGKLYYTGNRILPTDKDFENYDATLMSIVSDKSQYGRGAGNYSIVITLKDGRNFAWETDAASALFLTDDTLSESEIEIRWSVERAVISASRSEYKMPVIFSESYKGSFENIVGYRYYVDAECRVGILFNDLKDGEKYFVCADLIDTDNFVLEDDAVKIFTEPFTYVASLANLDLLNAVEKLYKSNFAIYVSGVCILGFSVLLIVSVIVTAGFIFIKKRKVLIGNKSSYASAAAVNENIVAEKQTAVQFSEGMKADGVDVVADGQNKEDAGETAVKKKKTQIRSRKKQ